MDELKMSIGERLKWRFHKLRMRIRFFIGSRLPDAGIAWKDARGYKVPVCPRCGDYVYNVRQCVLCGQHFLPGARTIGEVIDDYGL